AVVGDDESGGEALPDLLWELGFMAETFASAEEFLASDRVGEPSCLILDIAMPGMSGPDLQHELMRQRREIPIVFITAHADQSVRPPLLEQGAPACLLKPFTDTSLRQALPAPVPTA